MCLRRGRSTVPYALNSLVILMHQELYVVATPSAPHAWKPSCSDLLVTATVLNVDVPSRWAREGGTWRMGNVAEGDVMVRQS